MKQEPSYIAWCDVETTGTSAQENKLIQVATIITDLDLNILDEEGYAQEIYYSEAEVEYMKSLTIPYVLNMHTTNGLWEQLPNGKPMENVDKELSEYFNQFFNPGEAYLGGNSITLDRNFLDVNLPHSFEWLSYRSVDVSTIAVLAKHWYNGLEYPKKYTHDARDDIRESLAQLQFFRKTVFK